MADLRSPRDAASALRFNISHTRHLVACIVTRELDSEWTYD